MKKKRICKGNFKLVFDVFDFNKERTIDIRRRASLKFDVFPCFDTKNVKRFLFPKRTTDYATAGAES